MRHMNNLSTNLTFSPLDLLLSLPLYEPYLAQDIDVGRHDDEVGRLITYQGTLDTYCHGCQKDSTFTRLANRSADPYTYSSNNEVFMLRFSCSRSETHQIFFIFHLHYYTLTKIGQYPSIADLYTADLNKYRKVLGVQYPEFTKAVGLYAHGIGIGSFVYLRRIFEGLVEQAHQEANKQSDWDEDQYSRSRMNEKIIMLKALLPTFLVENNKLYAILSKGIHELTENECKSYFPTVRDGIELILDETMEQQERLNKITVAKKNINSIVKNLPI